MSDLTPPVTQSGFENEVLKSAIPVVVDFWAQWCGPCRALGPVLEELAPEYKGKVKILKLNVDQDGPVAARFNVMNIPTMIVFKGGKELDRWVGLLSREELEEKFRALAG